MQNSSEKFFDNFSTVLQLTTLFKQFFYVCQKVLLGKKEDMNLDYLLHEGNLSLRSPCLMISYPTYEIFAASLR